MFILDLNKKCEYLHFRKTQSSMLTAIVYSLKYDPTTNSN